VTGVDPITVDDKKLVKVTFQHGGSEVFDHVIFCTQPNVSSKIIGVCCAHFRNLAVSN
jgi:hypothetical protein